MTSDAPHRDPFAELASRSSEPSSRVLEAIRREVEAEPSARPGMSRRMRLALSAACLFVGLALSSLSKLRHDAQSLLIGGAIASLLLGGVLLALAAPGAAHRPDVILRRILVAALCAVAVLALGMQARTFLPVADFFGAEQAGRAAKCASHALLSGMLCSSGLLFVWRRTDPFTPGVTGALIGAMGGVLGIVSVEAGCPSIEGWHLLVGHGISVVVLATAGWLVGRRWLSP